MIRIRMNEIPIRLDKIYFIRVSLTEISAFAQHASEFMYERKRLAESLHLPRVCTLRKPFLVYNTYSRGK